MTRIVELSIGTGTVVGQASNRPEALAAVDHHQANIAVVEVQLPAAEGLAIIAELRAAHPSLLIVVCTFLADRATQQQARQAGADTYSVKPVSARELRESLVCPIRGDPLATTPATCDGAASHTR